MEEHRPKKLLDQVRDAIRLKHYSYRTEQAYVGWIKRYIYFHGLRHPADMGAPEVKAFLTHLAVKKNVAASTQQQALQSAKPPNWPVSPNPSAASPSTTPSPSTSSSAATTIDWALGKGLRPSPTCAYGTATSTISAG